ncbi:hypothetical protein ARTHRO9V_280318 [Arthrobacter sp. 9V]|nr:hypothetical protein ARTHRO9V_280318 [Arthrobacter sp. 9V]
MGSLRFSINVWHLNSFGLSQGGSADESHLVQGNVDVFTALIEQLAIEQSAVLGSMGALDEAHVFRAFSHGSPPFRRNSSEFRHNN